MPRPGRFYRSARWLACLDPLDGALQWADEVGRAVCAVVGGVLWVVVLPVRACAALVWHVLKPEPANTEWMANWARSAKMQLSRETDPKRLALRCLALWQITGEREWIDRADEAYPRWRWAWHRKAPARFGWAVVRILRWAFRRPPLARWAGHGRLPRRRV